MSGVPRDITGQRFGRLVAIRSLGRKNRSDYLWECRCDCGGTSFSYIGTLKNGGTKSCGCLQKENARAGNKLPYGVASFNMVYKNYKNAAERRGLAFEIEKEDFRALALQNCFYCNSTPKNKMKITNNGEFVYNGIDRVDNKKGYIYGNVVPCCGKCNKAKNSMGHQEFIDWVKSVYEFSVARLYE